MLHAFLLRIGPIEILKVSLQAINTSNEVPTRIRRSVLSLSVIMSGDGILTAPDLLDC